MASFVVIVSLLTAIYPIVVLIYGTFDYNAFRTEVIKELAVVFPFALCKANSLSTLALL